MEASLFAKVGTTLFALPGFLGLPSDWDNVFPKDLLHSEQIEFISIDLFSKQTHFPLENFSIASSALQTQARLSSRPRILMGYSLGGRLALHTLLRDPELWDGAIFLSTHPGLEHSHEKEDRMRSDSVWAKRFEEEEWGSLIEAWNHQPVFGSVTPPERAESAYDRGRLAQALQGCSLAHQEDFRLQLKNRKPLLPILWLVGEGDSKFLKLALEMRDQGISVDVRILPKAGHRLLQDQPKLVQESVLTFIASAVSRN